MTQIKAGVYRIIRILYLNLKDNSPLNISLHTDQSETEVERYLKVLFRKEGKNVKDDYNPVIKTESTSDIQYVKSQWRVEEDERVIRALESYNNSVEEQLKVKARKMTYAYLYIPGYLAVEQVAVDSISDGRKTITADSLEEAIKTVVNIERPLS